MARIASGLQMLSSSAKRAFFTARSSTTDSMTRSTSARSPRWVVADTRPTISSASASGALLLLDLLGQRRGQPGQHAVRRVLAAAAQDDLVARGRSHLGDARTHDPGPDDSYPRDGHGGPMLPAGNHGRSTPGRAPCVQEWRMTTNGLLALVGGVRVDRGLHLRRRAARRLGRHGVVVLPTAAAYQHPERVALQAAEWFAALGGQVEGLMVVDRADGRRPRHGRGGPPALASSISPAGPPSTSSRCSRAPPPSTALREAWRSGAVVAGSAAGAMVLTDPMVDPRGGALTVGLGLVDQLAVVPQYGDGLEDAHGQKLAAHRGAGPGRAARRRGSRTGPPCSGPGDGKLELRGRGTPGGVPRRRPHRGARRPAGLTARLGRCGSGLSPPRRSSPTRW